MTIRDAIRQMVMDIATKKIIRIGKATNIDKDKCVCDVDLGNGATLHVVKLKAIEDDKENGLVIIPKEGTMVCAAMLEGIEANWVIVQYSAIDSWQITTDSGSRITIADDGKVLLNGDDHKGIVKVKELTEKLNAIEDDINNLKNVFSGWTAVSQDGGAALKGAAAAWYAQQITKTQESDLKNDNVQHGDGA